MRLIDADALIVMEFEGIRFVPAEFIEDAEVIEDRKRGRWIPVTNGRGGFECDHCHNYAPSYQDGVEWLSTYCPSCGAEMRGEANERTD